MYKYNKKTGETFEYPSDQEFYLRAGDGCIDGFNSLEELNNWIKQLDEQPNLNNWAGGIHPSNKTWKNFLDNQCKFNFNFYGYDVYNATNCWYLVDDQGNVTHNIFGYHVWQVLQDLTGQPIKDIRDKFDSISDFTLNTGLTA